MAALRTVFCRDLFSGKVAVVTGGGTGIGKAITKELARLGCKVVIASRKMERLEEAAKEINREIVSGTEKSRVFSYLCNIRKEDQVIMCKCKLTHSFFVNQFVLFKLYLWQTSVIRLYLCRTFLIHA